MSVRVRLALGSAVIAAIVLFLVAGAAYGLHARSQYDDLDNSLVLTAEHFQEEFGTAGPAGERNDSVSQGPNIQVRLFDRNEVPLGSDAPNVPSVPVLPLQVLAEDDGPPYDAVLRWIPGGGIGGNFCPASFLPSRDVLIDGDAGLQLMAGAARTCVQVAVWRFVVGA